MEKVSNFGVTIFAGAESESIILSFPKENDPRDLYQIAFANRQEFFDYVSSCIDEKPEK